MEEFLAELWNVRGQLAIGLFYTFWISATAIAIGSVIGLFTGIGLCFGGRPVRWSLRVYVDVIRGTPVLVLILSSFYILAVLNVNLTAAASGVLALSLFCGAHLGEMLRGAFQAIPSTQIDGGKSLGLRMHHIILLVLLPQAIRMMAPVWTNTSVEIVKASTLLSIIGVGEMLLKTQEIIGRTFLTLEFYAVAGIIYFCINFTIETLGKRIERTARWA